MEHVEVYITLRWGEDTTPPKYKNDLTKTLLRWGRKNSIEGDFDVLKADSTGALIKIPSSALEKLAEASGQMLMNKGSKIATLGSVARKDKLCSQPATLSAGPQGFQGESQASLSTWPQGSQLQPSASLSAGPQGPQQPLPYSATSMAEAEALQSAPVTRPSLQQEPMQMERQRHPNHLQPDSVVQEDSFTCNVPIPHYWFLSHIYKERIARIEKEHRVKIQAEAAIKLEPLDKNGDPRKALEEFTKLVQGSSSESEGFSIDLKYMTPQAWEDTLSVVQKKENKVLIRICPEKMFVCGPDQSQDAISQYLSAIPKTSTNTKPSSMETAPAPSISRPTFSTNIDDPLVQKGITMEQFVWSQMNGPFVNQLSKLKDKFDVDFKEASLNSKGQVNIKAHYVGSAENPSMESHAIRALLQLHLRVQMKAAIQGAANSNDVSKHYSQVKIVICQPQGTSGGAAWSPASEPGTSDTKKMLAEGAAEGDGEDEKCIICQDPFVNKVQLRCKHEFCRECLESAMKSMGATCPLCKDVFGVLEGNQPHGSMTDTRKVSSLPGFPGCGTIVIDYHFSSGTQTVRHPSPGQTYQGTRRQAFLPDNKEGREVLRLLERAFKQKLTFTIGKSMTTNLDNQVTWNDIHHKTSESGGPQCYGYPDDKYLSRVKEELKAKGIE